ncbi:MAG TPA: response regulator transcription factor [Actinomycetota bacterium]|jgi:DNA-binding response OmpR family regulator|nr:response regulator transcription factor [Actinomycetota bacterium]
MGTRILVVEDEPGIAEPLVAHLEREGFEATAVGTVADARDAVEGVPPDAIVLDVMLPDGDGRDLCRELRTASDVPILLLTARGADADRIVGLELGADDYIVKPFSAGELVARIRAILRRTGRVSVRHVLEIADLRLDLDARTLTKGGTPVTLAAREFDLLALLMSRAGTVVRREDIMDEVWDPHWFGSTKTLDVHIAWLRKKLDDDPAHPRYITTIRGVGFRFTDPRSLG